jgi:cystathionine beta-lyase/cystathionine gamma-synthase
MREHERNARAVARFLAGHEDVAEVFYPGLTSHPQHELAKRQMRGFGGVVSFRPRGGAERARALAKATGLFNLATSLGGVESLICSPTVMTHASVSPERKRELGITEDLLRLSVGIEDEADLLADLDRAFEASRGDVPESTLLSGQREADGAVPGVPRHSLRPALPFRRRRVGD